MKQSRKKTETLKIQIPASIGQWLRDNVPRGKKTKFVVKVLQEQVTKAEIAKGNIRPPESLELNDVEEQIFQMLFFNIEEIMEPIYGKYYLHMPIDSIVVSIWFASSGAIKRYDMSKEVEEYWRKNQKALMLDEAVRNKLLKKLSNRWITENKASEPEELETRINDLMTIRDLLAELRCPREDSLSLQRVAGLAGVSYQTAYNKISPILIKLGYRFKDARHLSKHFTFDNL